MAMRPCQKCNENNWSYKHIDGWITATCNMCDFEVEFEAKKKSGKKKVFGKQKPKKTKKNDLLFLQDGKVLNSTQLIEGKKIEIYE